jgi:hypothetical protein
MPKGHAVIDGSNLATEGGTEPSLKQLDEAVRAIDAEYKFSQIIVIVDATFEHRVAKSETKAARAAIDSGDIITPPAGVIGRGDAFILQVADRADAVIFSNDSFQEFHGSYGWLFDEGRLIGGKPIPGVGWIYVARSPVRGPISRRATADSRKAAKKAAPRETGPKKRSAAEPKPAKPPAREARKRGSTSREPAVAASKPRRSPTTSRGGSGDGSNDAAHWKAFKADYPIGSTIAATVDRFSSHGAYGSVDGVVIYLPNRLLGDPAPTKARDVVDMGATMDFVIHRYDPDRNGIDAGLIPAPGSPPAATGKRTGRATTSRKAKKKAVPKKAVSKKAVSSRSTAKKAVSKKAPAKKVAAKRTPAKKAATKKAATKKAPGKKAPAAKVTAKKAPKKATATKQPAKKATKRR